MSDTQTALRHLIEANYAALPENLDVDRDDLFAQRYIDSLRLVRFICEVEASFDIELADAEIQSAQFRTLAGLAQLIETKRRGSGSN